MAIYVKKRMNLYKETKENGIRPEIAAFAAFMAMMLFQTDWLRLGTICASGLIFLVLWHGLSGKDILNSRFTPNVVSVSLVGFLVCATLNSLIQSGLPSYYSRLFAQILLCILLSQYVLNTEERKLLDKVFILSMEVYAILVLYSEMRNQGWNSHAKNELFGTSFDPNFIGIPLVASTAMLLNYTLKERNVKYALMYLIPFLAVINTSSHGNFLGLAVSNGLVLLSYLKEKGLPLTRKISMFTLILVVMLILIVIAAAYFPDEWNRMSTFTEDSDNGRFALWERSLEVWKTSPLLGIGLEGMYRHFGLANHNTYIQVLSETGVVGLVLFLSLIISLIKRTSRCSSVYTCIFVGVLLQMFFLDALDNRCVWCFFCWFAMLPKKRVNEEQRNQSKRSLRHI